MWMRDLLAANDRPVISVDRNMPVSRAIDLMGEKRIGAVPVVEDAAVIGIMSERDVIYCLRRHGAAFLDWPVGQVMTSPVISVDPDMSLLGALALMTRRRIRHLPVVEGGKMIGLVSIGDLVKARLDKVEAEAEAMRDYITRA